MIFLIIYQIIYHNLHYALHIFKGYLNHAAEWLEKYIKKNDVSLFGHQSNTTIDDSLVLKFRQGMNEGLSVNKHFVKKFSDKIEKKIKDLRVGYDVEIRPNEV